MKNSFWTRGMVLLALTAWFFGPSPVLGMPRLYAAAKPAVTGAPVNLNKASVQELRGIRGIGPAMAQRIVDYRSKFGKFERVEDLTKVPGIGSSKFEKMRSQITT